MSSVLLRSTLALGLAALSAPAIAAADFAACFSLTPGVSWSNGDDTITNAADRFAGQDVISVTTRGGGLARATFHDRSGRQYLGEVDYAVPSLGNNNSDAPLTTERYQPAPTFPASAVPGSRFKLVGHGQRTAHGGDTVTPIAYEGFSDYTFVGFEDLAVEIDYQPRTFKDTCHLRARIEGGHIDAWHAPGFGRIKFQRYDGDNLLMGEEIETILQE